MLLALLLVLVRLGPGLAVGQIRRAQAQGPNSCELCHKACKDTITNDDVARNNCHDGCEGQDCCQLVVSCRNQAADSTCRDHGPNECIADCNANSWFLYICHGSSYVGGSRCEACHSMCPQNNNRCHENCDAKIKEACYNTCPQNANTNANCGKLAQSVGQHCCSIFIHGR